jgi:hypothetical protein
MIAALFVETGGAYFGLPNVDPWDEARDARLYDGPWPVVAHPPCARWCRLAGLVEARYGKKKGDDGGCFASALASVRRWGGVLEHPAYSDAWATLGLPVPPSSGGWIGDLFGGWSCQVEQGHYGHLAPKETWLYAVGCKLPILKRGKSDAKMGINTWYPLERMDPASRKAEIPKRLRAATPQAFRDILIAMAESASREESPC